MPAPERTPSPTQRPPTVPAFVLGELRRLIGIGELVPGQPLRQEDLAARLGVSRVPVREALNTLETEGHVVHEPHYGYRVTELSLTDLLEVYRLRQLLEAEAVRATIALGGTHVLADLRAAGAEVELAHTAGDLLTMNEANRRFHFVLVTSSGLPRLERILRALWDSTEAYRRLYYEEPGNRARALHEHAGIVDAFAAGDAELVIRLLDEHRGHATTVLGALLPQ
ncbi:GntR family transcriptional regulator [Cryobacterium sp. Y11]|uniref:GntR family transcriptional regulator n=1 Tax=Cryobacterium sp. Y11 TaxID=2045016 RepID=UPI000CE41E4F|nr:GntR family transcriptional regulator [Cryobacterium sp. Y11]